MLACGSRSRRRYHELARFLQPSRRAGQRPHGRRLGEAGHPPRRRGLLPRAALRRRPSIRLANLPKGDAFAVARLAGIQGAKRDRRADPARAPAAARPGGGRAAARRRAASRSAAASSPPRAPAPRWRRSPPAPPRRSRSTTWSRRSSAAPSSPTCGWKRRAAAAAATTGGSRERCMTVRTGLDRLLADPRAPRRPALRPARPRRLDHRATCAPIHLALAAAPAAPPAALFGPEHGFYGVEQDMVGRRGRARPLDRRADRLALRRLARTSCGPRPAAFAGLDLLLIDLQDVGARYYTYAATAVWAAEAALAAGCEVWVLDRPNPLGGEVVEGNLPRAGLRVLRRRLPPAGAPRPDARRAGPARSAAPRLGRTASEVWPMEGWRRAMPWEETGLPWIAPSPNMPTPRDGAGLSRAAAWSRRPSSPRGAARRGRSSSSARRASIRVALADAPERRAACRGVAFVPTYFRPQFQKHARRGLRRRRAGGDRRARASAPTAPASSCWPRFAGVGAARPSPGARRPTSSSPTGRRSTC